VQEMKKGEKLNRLVPMLMIRVQQEDSWIEDELSASSYGKMKRNEAETFE
jgi:hypothetical protein